MIGEVVDEMVHKHSTDIAKKAINEAFEEERKRESKVAFKMDAE